MKTFIAVISFSLLTAIVSAQTEQSSVRLTENAAYAMLTSLLKERNIDFSQRELMTGYGAFGASIEAHFPAHPDISEGSGLFVLAVPVSNGTETPLNWGHELALSLIDRLRADPLPFETVICFTGDSWPPYAGLNALFDELDDRDDCFVVYCEFPEPPAALVVAREWGKSASPLGLVEPLFRLCAENGTPCFFGMGASGAEDTINKRGGDVPALVTSGNMPVWTVAAKTGKNLIADDVAALLHRYAETVMRNGLQETDINYVFFGLNQSGFFISGFTLVLAALFGLSFFVFLYFFLRIAAKSRWKRIFISVLAVFVIIPALMLFVTHINSPRRAKTAPPPTMTLGDASAESYLSAGAESRILLERRIVSINIEAALEPLRYRLFFTSSGERGSTESPLYSVYNAPIPYTVEAGHIEFMLGSYPPNPLKLEIALPLDLAGDFGIEAFLEGGINITQTFATVP